VGDSVISHLGIAVRDLDAAIRLWKVLLGTKPTLITDVPDQKVKVAIFSKGFHDTGGRIELVAPTSLDSPIQKFLDTRGEGLHHVCVYVENLDHRLNELTSAGVRLIDKVPRIGAEGHRIAFVHPIGTGGVLLELEEKPDSGT
jgi:methylmalonyl-CoA/ethylmalonyl-CoA epimerase